ncbi:MAG: AAA family ATPase [Verrucomicrobia bacterium]|nr:MAG: AAA family ATPase [Verrucomicrobiota bacterium]
MRFLGYLRLRYWQAGLPASRSARRDVNQKVLLTGRPGCGKTTLVKRVVKNLPQRAAGFYTEEIRDRDIRVGFRLVTLDGDEGVLAHVDFETPERLGKYRLDLSALETVAVNAVRDAVRARQLVVIDEIGPMEIRSAMFRDTINEVLESGLPLLATIFARSLRFTDAIKMRPDVTLIEVRPDNRERLVFELSEILTTR